MNVKLPLFATEYKVENRVCADERNRLRRVVNTKVSRIIENQAARFSPHYENKTIVTEIQACCFKLAKMKKLWQVKKARFNLINVQCDKNKEHHDAGYRYTRGL
ncbi:hypothetical protein J6590_086126 [Homalodisca vitripennis]|nr:hypothetical protein J6590_086126 [Homalodisca vitripennis]